MSIKVSNATIVAKVKTLLETAVSELQNKIKLSEFLARKIPYEYHYISSVFSQAEGITIEGYFIRLKITLIKELLKKGDVSISEISHRCGYSSPAHLTNQFKRTTGITPSKFRSMQKR